MDKGALSYPSASPAFFKTRHNTGKYKEAVSPSQHVGKNVDWDV